MAKRMFRRSKSRFPTSRSAWLDIKAKRKVGHKGLKTAHTKKSWVWKD